MAEKGIEAPAEQPKEKTTPTTASAPSTASAAGKAPANKPNWEIVQGVDKKPMRAQKESGFMYFMGPAESDGFSTVFRTPMARREPLSEEERARREAAATARTAAHAARKEGWKEARIAKRQDRIAAMKAKLAKLEGTSS